MSHAQFHESADHRGLHGHPAGPPRRDAARAGLLGCLVSAAGGFAIVAGGVAIGATPLDTPVNSSWTGVPLRGWAEQISKLAGQPVVLDRRLDPDLPVTRQCRGESVGELLTEVAAVVDADVVGLQSTIRIAPRDMAAACGQAEAIRARELAALPRRQRAVPQSTRSWTWPDGARPADLLAAVAAEATVTIVGLETVPHDHLAGRTLPPLTLAERLDLVLADFDKRISWRPATSGETPTAVIVSMTGHDAPVAAAKPPRTPAKRKPGPAAAAGPTRFTLRAAAPLDQLLASVAAQLGLTLALDSEALAARGIAAAEIVRLEVKDASRDQLLDAIVKPLQLTWRIEGDTLRVGGPAPAAD
jgi:hypothetical protein